MQDARLDQVMAQLAKLVDGRSVKRHGANHEVFESLESFFR